MTLLATEFVLMVGLVSNFWLTYCLAVCSDAGPQLIPLHVALCIANKNGRQKQPTEAYLVACLNMNPRVSVCEIIF